MEKLHIADYREVQIIKVKDWAISFKYKRNYYLLHISECDYEAGVTLYRRIPNEKIAGSFAGMEALGSNYASSSVWEQFLKQSDYKKTYKQIDKDYFVRKMTIEGLCSSYLDMEEYKRKCKRLQEKINFHNDMVHKLRAKQRRLI